MLATMALVLLEFVDRGLCEGVASESVAAPSTMTRHGVGGEEEYKLGRAHAAKAEATTDADAANAEHRTAADWYRRAANRGHAGAQYSLGLLFANGE